MKKFIALFFSLALLIACSSDDDNDNQGPDPIIGTWVLVEASAPLNNIFCMEEESTLTFNENKTGSASFYITEDDCEPTASTGNWNNLGNSTYSITVPVVGVISGNVTFTGNRFTFTSPAMGSMTFQKQ